MGHRFLLVHCLVICASNLVAAPAEAGKDRTAMTEAFAAGVLPSPLALPSGDPDHVAIQLAKNVSHGGSNALPALESALLVAGFSIRGARGGQDAALWTVTTHGQGLAFEGWQIAAMSKSYAEGRSISLLAFADALSKALPGIGTVPLAAGLVSSVRSNFSARQPAIRFLANFFVALGREGDQPYDLMDPNLDVTKVRFDPIQTSILLERVIGDLGSGGAKQGRRARAGSLLDFPFASLQPAVFWSGLRPSLSIAAEEGGKGPCNSDEQTNTILDGASSLETTFFTRLWEFAAEHTSEEFASFLRTGTPAVNSLILAMKTFNALTAIKVDIQMSGGLPFVRTKDNAPAETRLLTATVSVDSGRWEALNCARFALNWLGIDPKVLAGRPPQNGDRMEVARIPAPRWLFGTRCHLQYWARPELSLHA